MNSKLSDMHEMIESKVSDLLNQLTQDPFGIDPEKIAADLNDLTGNIGKTMERHFVTLRSDLKLDDSIFVYVQHENRQPRKIFSENIAALFCNIYQSADESTRRKMWNLRQSWNDEFDADLLKELDEELLKLDPTWLVKNDPYEKETYSDGSSQAEDDDSSENEDYLDFSGAVWTEKEQLLETDNSSEDYSDDEEYSSFFGSLVAAEVESDSEQDNEDDAEVFEDDESDVVEDEDEDEEDDTEIFEDDESDVVEDEVEDEDDEDDAEIFEDDDQFEAKEDENEDEDEHDEDMMEDDVETPKTEPVQSLDNGKVEKSSEYRMDRKRTKSLLAHVAQVMDGLSTKSRICLERKILNMVFEAEEKEMKRE